MPFLWSTFLILFHSKASKEFKDGYKYLKSGDGYTAGGH